MMGAVSLAIFQLENIYMHFKCKPHIYFFLNTSINKSLSCISHINPDKCFPKLLIEEWTVIVLMS